jgi:hypothetical protein
MPRMGAKSLLKSNILYWMNDMFLRNGLYENVSAGETDFNTNDISLMNPVVNHPTYADGRMFQSSFKNWVYEPGITSSESGVASPIVASGVTVDGTFYNQATTSGTYAHFIDFPNGAAVFNSPLPGSPVVQGTFSYKMVHVENAGKVNNENKQMIIETQNKDNPQQSGVIIYPEERAYTLPAVFIDFQKRNSLPYELGTKKPIKQFLGVFHIWSHDDFVLDIVEDLLADSQRDVLLGIDFNTAPFPLLSRGRINPAWAGYSAYANLYSPYFWRRIYLDSSNPTQDPPLFEVERTRVNFEIKVYANF